MSRERYGRRSAGQRGQALMITTAFTAIVVMLIFATLTMTNTAGYQINRQILSQGQATNVASAGLIEGLSWFRRQTTQPVTLFAPIRNLAATPPIDDTDNQASGLRRDFLISAPGNVWGRYELTRSDTAGSNTMDITAIRGKSGAGVGTAWQMESTGTVWRGTPGSGRLLARRTLRSEIERLSFQQPGNGALVTTRNNCATIGANVRIRGGSSFGMMWYDRPTTGQLPNGAGWTGNVSGTPSRSGLLTPNPTAPDVGRFSILNVFGVTQQELLRMATFVVSTVNELPAPATGPFRLPDMALTVIDSAPGTWHVFDENRPLSGTGVLVVFGNLRLAAGSFSNFSGVVYVRGEYNQGGNSVINGTVIIDAGMTGTSRIVNVAGTGGGGFAEINYDPQMLAQIRRRMGLYTLTRGAYIPCPPAPQVCR